MQLTTQMQAEVETIGTRVQLINDQIWIPLRTELMKHSTFTPEDEVIGHEIIAELNPYKVRLENILCETDKKEHVRSNYSDLIMEYAVGN